MKGRKGRALVAMTVQEGRNLVIPGRAKGVMPLLSFRSEARNLVLPRMPFLWRLMAA